MTPSPHSVINYFLLYFPSEESARRAARRPLADGYHTDVRDNRAVAAEIAASAGDNGDAAARYAWSTYVTAPLPESGDIDLDEVEEYMETLAADEGGNYDGYERDARRE